MFTSAQLSELMTMHTYRRPHGSRTEREFIHRYLDPLDVEPDAHRNLHVMIGDDPRIVFSSHTDTVHSTGGRQRIGLMTDGTLCTYWSDADCLGADDTAGVFLMRQMILAGIPGHYIFHFGEEVGCEGSGDLARLSPEILDGCEIAIAFDRGNHTDVITHQGGRRTCSDTFARSLCAALDMGYAPCDRGIYTDTREYKDIVPECTNVSVGYLHAHSGDETLDTVHLSNLLDRLLVLDWSSLVVERDPVAEQAEWFEQLKERATAGVKVVRKWFGSDVSQPIIDADVRDYSADCYLTSWECFTCSRMNRDALDVCLNCGTDRHDNADLAALRDMLDRRTTCECTYARIGGHEPDCPYWTEKYSAYKLD